MVDGLAGPRGRYYHGWNIVAALTLSQAAVNGIAVNCFSLFLPNWTAEFHAQPSQLIIAIALETLVASMMAPMIGAWADKYPARVLFGAGLAGHAVFCLLLSFATQSWHILALFGLILPLPILLSAAVPANSLLSRWFVRRLGMAVGICSFGLGLAGVVLPPVVSYLIPTLGWRTLWQVNAAVILFVILPIVVYAVRNRPDPARDGLHYLTADAKGGLDVPSHGHGAPAAAGTLSIKDVLRRRGFWMLIGMVMPLLAVDIAIMHNIVPYAMSHGLSRPVAGSLMSVTFIAHLVAALVIGWVCDRIGTRIPFATLILLAIAGCTLLGIASGFGMILPGLLMIGIVGASFTLLPIGIAAEFGQAGFGRAFGCAIFFLPIPVATAAAFAKVQEVTGDYTLSLVGAAALMAIPTVLLMFYRKGEAPTAKLIAAEA